MNKICEWCGAEMIDVRSDKKYCCGACQKQASRARQKQGVNLSEKICPHCGKSFKVKTMGYGRNYCYNCVPETETPRSGAEMRKIIKIWMVEEKGGKCQICGYNKCIDAMDLHHLDPSEKEFNLSDRNLRYGDWANIKKEIRKGILVCSNCHREIHAGLHSEFLKEREGEQE